MSEKGLYRFKSEGDQVRHAVGLMVRNMQDWRRVLKPLLDDAVADMKADGHLPESVADGLNDFGRYCQDKGDEVALARKAQGVVTRPKPKK